MDTRGFVIYLPSRPFDYALDAPTFSRYFFIVMKDLFFKLFSSLRHKNFRLYMAAQSLSLTGTSMQQVAISWLLYRLTDSTSWLGWLGFGAQIPVALFITGAGVLADRFDRRSSKESKRECEPRRELAATQW